MSDMKNIRKAKDSEKIRLLVDEWIKKKEYLKNDIGVEKLGNMDTPDENCRCQTNNYRQSRNNYGTNSSNDWLY